MLQRSSHINKLEVDEFYEHEEKLEEGLPSIEKIDSFTFGSSDRNKTRDVGNEKIRFNLIKEDNETLGFTETPFDLLPDFIQAKLRDQAKIRKSNRKKHHEEHRVHKTEKNQPLHLNLPNERITKSPSRKSKRRKSNRNLKNLNIFSSTPKKENGYEINKTNLIQRILQDHNQLMKKKSHSYNIDPLSPISPISPIRQGRSKFPKSLKRQERQGKSYSPSNRRNGMKYKSRSCKKERRERKFDEIKFTKSTTVSNLIKNKKRTTKALSLPKLNSRKRSKSINISKANWFK